MTSVATHALRACSSLGALCSFKPCTIISQLANFPAPILLQAIIIVFFQFKNSSHESLITFFYNSLKNIKEHILGLSPFVQGTTLCILNGDRPRFSEALKQGLSPFVILNLRQGMEEREAATTTERNACGA